MHAIARRGRGRVADRLDPDPLWERGGRTLVGGVELALPGGQFLVRCGGSVQKLADSGAHGVPLGPLQEVGTRVGPAGAARDEDLALTQARLQLGHEAERVRLPVHRLAGRPDVPAPPARHKRQRSTLERLGRDARLGVEPAQERRRLRERACRLCRGEVERL